MDIGYLGEYLQWRGDLTFAQAPFCAADSLMLTMLSYLTPEKVTVPGEKNVGIRLGELARRYDLFYVPEKNPGRLSIDGESTGTSETDGVHRPLFRRGSGRLQ